MTALPAAKMTGRTHFLGTREEVLIPVDTQAVLFDNPRSWGNLENIFGKADVFLYDMKHLRASNSILNTQNVI